MEMPSKCKYMKIYMNISTVYEAFTIRISCHEIEMRFNVIHVYDCNNEKQKCVLKY